MVGVSRHQLSVTCSTFILFVLFMEKKSFDHIFSPFLLGFEDPFHPNFSLFLLN